jgi:hypothetical protein
MLNIYFLFSIEFSVGNLKFVDLGRHFSCFGIRISLWFRTGFRLIRMTGFRLIRIRLLLLLPLLRLLLGLFGGGRLLFLLLLKRRNSI